MTWKNLPCAPTLPALFAACPHGWAEINITSHPGNPTADPPQDADSSIEVGRVYGVEESDLYLAHDLAADLHGDPPHGLPSDCTALVRFTYGKQACIECGKLKGEDQDWICSKPGCSGPYMTPVKAELTWGPDKSIPHFIGEDAPEYIESFGAHVYRNVIGEPPPQPGHGDMWQQVIDRYVDSGTNSAVLDIFRKRREMGIVKYKTPLQAGNGRNPLRDLLDETLNRIVYIEQAITEVPGRAASLRTEQDNDVELVEVLLGMQGFEDTGEECRAKYLRSIGETDPMRAAAAAIGVDPDRATVPEVAATINAVYSDAPVLCDFCKKPYESTRAHRLGLCVG